MWSILKLLFKKKKFKNLYNCFFILFHKDPLSPLKKSTSCPWKNICPRYVLQTIYFRKFAFGTSQNKFEKPLLSLRNPLWSFKSNFLRNSNCVLEIIFLENVRLVLSKKMFQNLLLVLGNKMLRNPRFVLEKLISEISSLVLKKSTIGPSKNI